MAESEAEGCLALGCVGVLMAIGMPIILLIEAVRSCQQAFEENPVKSTFVLLLVLGLAVGIVVSIVAEKTKKLPPRGGSKQPGEPGQEAERLTRAVHDEVAQSHERRKLFAAAFGEEESDLREEALDAEMQHLRDRLAKLYAPGEQQGAEPHGRPEPGEFRF